MTGKLEIINNIYRKIKFDLIFEKKKTTIHQLNQPLRCFMIINSALLFWPVSTSWNKSKSTCTACFDCNFIGLFYFKRNYKFIAKWAAIHRISNNILGVAAILIYHNSHWILILRPAAVFPWALIAIHQWKTLRKLSQKNWKWPKIEYVCCTEKSNYLISHFHILFICWISFSLLRFCRKFTFFGNSVCVCSVINVELVNVAIVCRHIESRRKKNQKNLRIVSKCLWSVYDLFLTHHCSPFSCLAHTSSRFRKLIAQVSCKT